MDRYFTKILHQLTKSLRGGDPLIPASAPFDEVPESWTSVRYKTYPRLKKVALPPFDAVSPLDNVLGKRKTRRDFSDDPVSLETLSTVLHWSGGVVGTRTDGKPVRPYPSGGALYPIEIYPVVFCGTTGLRSGVYHYNIKEHALDVLEERHFEIQDIRKLCTYSWAQHASVLLVMTCLFTRTQEKYGERGYRFALLEAGHIGQNVYLNAEASGLKCCANGGTIDTQIEQLLDVDGVDESMVYSILLGG